MKLPSIRKTDPFVQAPLVTLLPTLGNLETLTGLKTFLFARYEKVEALRQAALAREDRVPEQTQAEVDMLTEVLDWLKMSPTKE